MCIDDKFINAVIQVESGGDDQAVGDKHLINKAYGCLQIRQPAVDDINRTCSTRYKAQDCLGNRELAIWMFHQYAGIYATSRRLGRMVTNEDRARIWNAGPAGWKKDGSRRDALATMYWKKVQQFL